jgi:hypothetical protein
MNNNNTLTPADLSVYTSTSGNMEALGYRLLPSLTKSLSMSGGGTSASSTGTGSTGTSASGTNKSAESILAAFKNLAVPAGLFIKPTKSAAEAESTLGDEMEEEEEEVNVISNDLYEQLVRLSEINKVVLKLTKRNPKFAPVKKSNSKTKKQKKMTKRMKL